MGANLPLLYEEIRNRFLSAVFAPEAQEDE
jgi:hypothetical protein